MGKHLGKLEFWAVWAELFGAETAMKAKKNHRIRNEYGDFYVVRVIIRGLEIKNILRCLARNCAKKVWNTPLRGKSL